jgi:hypothetical protein
MNWHTTEPRIPLGICGWEAREPPVAFINAASMAFQGTMRTNLRLLRDEVTDAQRLFETRVSAHIASRSVDLKNQATAMVHVQEAHALARKHEAQLQEIERLAQMKMPKWEGSKADKAADKKGEAKMMAAMKKKTPMKKKGKK